MRRMLTRHFLSVAVVVALIVPQYPVTAARPAADITTLPSFHRGGEALAVDARGTMIVGYAWDARGRMHAAKWTMQNGSWAFSDLLWPAGATSTIARGVNNRGDVAGNDFSPTASRALLWLTGTSSPLIVNCSTDLPEARVYGISADAQVVIGAHYGPDVVNTSAAVWRPDGTCREDLPLLIGVGGDAAQALAVNGDGTVIGGGATVRVPTPAAVPVRWTKVVDEWRIEQLDTRSGSVWGANGTGDLVGYVETPCGSGAVCQRAVIWYATGESRELGTPGGANSLARDINSNGEVVGASGTRAFFWSPAVDMLPLAKGRTANALSDVRPDGTRLVVGQDARGGPIAWVVRNP
jgi:uncharacterized membrane protein